MENSGKAFWLLAVLDLVTRYLAWPWLTHTTTCRLNPSSPVRTSVSGTASAPPTISGGLDYSSKTISQSKMTYILQNYASDCTQVTPGIVATGPGLVEKKTIAAGSARE